ncbi:MAG: type II toxin-antitoxin system Phd/YefM family antitoxin [Verrucomicrobiota bacterium]|nr:type II toxin-antitoxin system Phd/YefM family antitoxin [Chthoniobacterales bacterium]MDQ3414349.1 type II toxin-antitoxin system Phd/YefM family antitoxin [Verrucomicrobiota bacterium]
MKIIPSRDLVASPAKVWKLLAAEGSVVITKDGKPRGILLPTSDLTLVEDLQDQIRARARRAVSELRRQAARRGTDKLSAREIDAEIGMVRRNRSR